MSVTDPDVPDPLNDPRTLQADPGAYGEGEDLASAADDPATSGQEELEADQAAGADPELEADPALAAEAELATGRTPADDAGGGDVTGGASPDAPGL